MVLPRDLIKRCARNFPSQVAFVCGAASATWRQMDERSDRLAAALQRQGIGKGDVAAILSQERIEIHQHFYACMKIGAVRVGVNPRYAWPELRHVLADSGTRVLVVEGRCREIVDRHRDEIDALGIILIGLGDGHGYPLDFESLLAESTERPAWPALAEDDPLFYSYTSGTTGLPKGVILTHGGLADVIVNSVMSFGFSPDDLWYNPSGSSWVTMAMTCFNLGNAMTSVIPDGAFEVGAFLGDIARSRVTVVMLVPTMLQWVMRECRANRHDLSSLRAVIYGSAPSSPRLIREAKDTLGVDLIQTYGLTEATGGWVTYLSNKDHLRGFESRPELLTSIGRVGMHFECSVRDAEENCLPPGTRGEIWLRGPAVMKGYLNRPAETAETLRDGWLRSNDIGYMDEEGFVYLLDRQKYMIITGGVNVYPSAVEAVLAEHPAVLEVAVVGAAHPEWGEAVVAFITMNGDWGESTAREIIGWCRGRLAGHEIPKHVIVVDELPKTSNAKVKKFELQQRLRKDPSLLPWTAD